MAVHILSLMKYSHQYSFSVLSLFSIGIQAVQAVEKPNILWLTFEDTSPQFIGCYGNNAAHTPMMDSLNVNGGVRFNYAYSNSTVSSPSRSCIITGRDANITGTGHHRYQRTLPDDVKGFPYYLRQAGYYTTNNSKTDYNILNPAFISEAWNESSDAAHWRKRPTSNTPFFSVFNINYSHQSYTTRNEYAYYQSNVYNLLDKNNVTNPENMIVPDFYRNDPEMRFLMTRVQNCINYTDQVMGDYLQELKTDGLDQNTIVFMFADHGEGIPRGKTCALGMGYRVPFIVWFPEKWKHLNPFNGQSVTDKQICFEDLAPTILKLAGITPPEVFNGSVFLGEGTTTHQQYIHGFRNRIGESPGIERSVIKERYVYTRVFSPYIPTVKNQGYDYNCDILCTVRKQDHYGVLTPQQQEPFMPRVKEYLYDLQTDTWETNNLAANPDYQTLVDELRTEMVRYVKSIKDLGFMPEYEMQRRSVGTTPMQLRDNYDIDAIVDAAMLVGDGNTVLSQQIELLENSNELVRYWAAVGIYNQAELAVPYEPQIKIALEQETFDGARIELAAFLYNYCNDTTGGEILRSYAKNTDELLANDAVVKIQYLGEKTVFFKDIIDEIQPYWATNDANYCVSPGVNTTQIIINNMLKNPVSEVLTDGITYSVRNSLTGGYIGVQDSSLNANALVNQTLKGTRKYAQWKLEKRNNGYYSLVNANSSLALSMNTTNLANNAKPFQATYTGGNGQLWTLEPFQYGYKLINKATQKTLQVNSQSKNEGAVVSQWDWNGKLHFNWVLELPQNTQTGLPILTQNTTFARISSVYPNPINGNSPVTISYNLHEAAIIEMKLLDLSGKVSWSSYEGIQIPGQYSKIVTFPQSLSSGCYVIEIVGKTSGSTIKDTKTLIINSLK